MMYTKIQYIVLFVAFNSYNPKLPQVFFFFKIFFGKSNEEIHFKKNIVTQMRGMAVGWLLTPDYLVWFRMYTMRCLLRFLSFLTFNLLFVKRMGMYFWKVLH